MSDSEKPQCCEKHRDLTVHCTDHNSSDIGTPYQHGICVYCIMDGDGDDDLRQELDNWRCAPLDVITSDVVSVILLGVFDWNRGVQFLRDFKPGPREYPECQAVREYYKLGQRMGGAGVTNSIGEHYTVPVRW